MDLDHVLARCRAFETRAATIYRTYAARTRQDPDTCAMWTALARDEEGHARAIGRAAGWLDGTQGWRTHLEGWDEDLQEIEARLAQAESPDVGADVDRQLVAALALERTELDALFHRLLALLPASERPRSWHDHTDRLLATAARHAANPAVAFEAALLQARRLLRDAS
jgi:rubrerythrin